MSDVSERIARMIERDAKGEINRTLRVAQSDVAALLREFMDVTKLDMYFERADNGYELTIKADVARFYGVGKTSEIH